MTLSARPARRLRTLRVAPLLAAFAVSLASIPAWSQEAPAAPELPPLPEVSDEYRKAMRKYLVSQGPAAQIGQGVAYQVANETLMMIAQSGAQVTEPMQQIVLEEAQSAYESKFSDLDYLAALWAPVYKQHFELDELNAMTKWFETELGQKVVKLSPEINQRGMLEVQKASIAMSPEFQLAVDARLREAGLVQDAPPAQP